LEFLQQHILTGKGYYQADDDPLGSKHAGKSTQNKIVLIIFKFLTNMVQTQIRF